MLANKLLLLSKFAVCHQHFCVDTLVLVSSQGLVFTLIDNKQRYFTYLLVSFVFLVEQLFQESKQLTSFEQIKTSCFTQISKRAENTKERRTG